MNSSPPHLSHHGIGIGAPITYTVPGKLKIGIHLPIDCVNGSIGIHHIM
jgi:hypothetical protein